MDAGNGPRIALAAAATPLLGAATVLLVLGGAGASGSPSAYICGGGGTGQTIAGVRLDAEQMANARTVVSVVAGRRLPAFAAEVAVTTAYTESTLHNSAAHTDHDSEGLFQQRVSVYGKQVADNPANATNAFLDRLVRVPGWRTTTVGADAQAVQRSAHPERYQPNAALAQQLVGRLWPAANVAAPTVEAPTTRQFFTAVLTKLGAPPSVGNLNALYAVAQLEGQNDRYNPLNSVIPQPGSSDVNLAHVQRYASFDSGVAGTVALLRGAHWTAVRAALTGDTGTTVVLAAFRAAYTWDPQVRFPITNVVSVAARVVGPAPAAATQPAVCAGGGGTTRGGQVAGTIVGPTGNTIAGTTQVPAGLVITGTAKGDAAVRYALAQLGKPYVFGAAGPDSFDCSGLTMAAWSTAGVALPHLAAEQAHAGTTEPANLSQAVGGDLVFIPGSDGTAANPGHVGMVAGYVDRADGRHLYLVQAPDSSVPIELTEATEWSGQIVTVRHVA